MARRRFANAVPLLVLLATVGDFSPFSLKRPFKPSPFSRQKELKIASLQVKNMTFSDGEREEGVGKKAEDDGKREHAVDQN